MIQNDFTVYPYSKVIRHTSSNDTVYTVTAFYSFLQNLFDEPGYMSYQKPIKYNTPSSYTMLNGWFLDNGDGSDILKYLTQGTIDTSGYTNDVLMVDVDTVTVDWVAGDKDKTITDDVVDVGPLLAYKNDYATVNEGRIWVRDTESHGAIADGSAIATTGGSGAATANGASITGEEIYTNIYTIAAFVGAPDPQVYIRQNHPQTNAFNTRIAEWSNANSWDRGSIDVLFPVKLGGAAIDSGQLAVYVRQTGDSFTHTEATVSTTGGARTPIATETSADTVNITKGEHYLLYDAGSTGSFTAGDVIQDVSTDSITPPSWYAEVVAVTEFTVNTTGVLTLRGLRGSITDGVSIYVGTVAEATTNGTPGGTYTKASAISIQLGLGLICTGGTSTAKRKLMGFDTAEKAYVFAVDETVTGSAKDVFYIDFSSSETITDTATGSVTHQAATSTSIISDYTDITIAHVNGTCVTGAPTGTFEVGEKVTWTGGGPAIYITDNGTNEITLGNVEDETNLNINATVLTGASSGATISISGTAGMTDAYKENFNFPLQSAYEYAVVVECGDVYRASAGLGRDLDDVYAYLQYRTRDGETTDFYTSTGAAIVPIDGQFYIKAYSTYSAIKSAPFGTLAGGVFFSAQGVWVQGMVSADSNNIKLTDDSGILREPYTSVDVTVSNTRVGDVITVFLEAGSTSLPDKTQFSCVANLQSASTLQGSATHPNDTPSSGWVYVVNVDANEEHKYRYTSWSTDTLTLAAEVIGTAEAGTSGQTLFDTGVFASGVERGDIIRRTTDNTWCYVISVDNANQVTTTVLSDGSDWAVGNTFEVNSLVVAYTTSDKYFIPYLEGIENTGTEGSPGSETNSLTYVSDRSVVIRVRNVTASTKIQPFVTTSNITSAGMIQSVIRTLDEVYA